MAWGAIKLAKKGLEWQNRSESITITAVKTGSGIRTEPVEEMEDLVQVRQAAEITDMKITESMKQIHAKFTGRNIPESYAFRELGVYGKVTGTEDVFLYAACFFEEGEPALVSAENPAEFYSILTMRIGNAAEMTIEISESDYFTRSEAEEMELTLSQRLLMHTISAAHRIFVQTNTSSSEMEARNSDALLTFEEGDVILFIPAVTNAAAVTLDVGAGAVPLKNPAAARMIEANEMAPHIPYVLVYEIIEELPYWSVQLPYLQRYTTSGTCNWTAPYTGLYEVTVTGGGGGGGASRSTTLYSCSGGGGSGGTAVKRIWFSAGTSVSVTVGAGGAAATSSTNGTMGGTGGTSSFGSYCSATGAAGGYSAYNTSTNLFLGKPGGNLGVASGGDLNLRGEAGGPGYLFVHDVTSSAVAGGNGGNSYWAAGGSGRIGQNATNTNTGQYGSGGGGAITLASGSTTYRGSAGGTGIVQIRFLGIIP